MTEQTDDGADDPFFQALMQLTDTNKKVTDKLWLYGMLMLCGS